MGSAPNLTSPTLTQYQTDIKWAVRRYVKERRKKVGTREWHLYKYNLKLFFLNSLRSSRSWTSWMWCHPEAPPAAAHGQQRAAAGSDPVSRVWGDGPGSPAASHQRTWTRKILTEEATKVSTKIQIVILAHWNRDDTFNCYSDCKWERVNS